MKNLLITALLIAAFASNADAWIYPEHRGITALAIQKLDPARRAELEQFWTLVRKGHESRLFATTVDTSNARKPKFIDFASWPAISGDHSTSPVNLLYEVLETEWILGVADVAAELKTGIANARNRSERINKLKESDLKLFRVDPDYVTRAGSNNVHFMLYRMDVNTKPDQYFDKCCSRGCEMNAMGTYAWFHTSALLKAQKFAEGTMGGEERRSLMMSALADEAFALHFLEDLFASGHVAGPWGNAAQRKGTHDYYNEKGLEVTTWSGERTILMGDAFMRPADAERTANDVLKSLQDFLDAAGGRSPVHLATDENLLSGPDTLNISKMNFLPPRKVDTAIDRFLIPVFMPTAVPGLTAGIGELPRFRSEVGPFIGLAAAATGSAVFSGFDKEQNTTGAVGGLEMSIRLGLGLEGVLNEAGDGLVFLDLGWKQDGSSSMKFATDPDLKQFGSISSAIPSRDAFYARLRLPFYLIPGDLLIVAPILYLFAPKAMTKMIIAAGNGGLLPWQSGMVTSIGRFQFILGREVGVYLYGNTRAPDRFIIPVTLNNTPDQVMISMRTTQLEFPIVEYRPFHSFSSNQTASLVAQIYGGFDIPGKVTVISPVDTPAPKVKTTLILGLRIAFDWRYYFAQKRK